MGPKGLEQTPKDEKQYEFLMVCNIEVYKGIGRRKSRGRSQS